MYCKLNNSSIDRARNATSAKKYYNLTSRPSLAKFALSLLRVRSYLFFRYLFVIPGLAFCFKRIECVRLGWR